MGTPLLGAGVLVPLPNEFWDEPPLTLDDLPSGLKGAFLLQVKHLLDERQRLWTMMTGEPAACEPPFTDRYIRPLVRTNNGTP